jgi:transcriptional regulator with XRE-family HTH domain
MDVASVSTLLADPGVPPAELARRAGVSRNTEWALRKDQSRANLATLRELALACGSDLTVSAVPASDPLASAAARSILGDLETDSSEDFVAWETRLKRWTGHAAPLDIALEAGRVSAPQHRTEAHLFSGRNDVDRLTSAGIASGSTWVLSGAAALEALDDRPSEPELPVIVWSADVERFAQLLLDTHRSVRVQTSATVIVAPLHPSMLAGMTNIEGVPLVSPIQAVIDCFGVGGELADRALEIAKDW